MALRSPLKYNQYRGNTLVTAPAVEPITKTQVKDQLSIDTSDASQDDLFDLLIGAARQQCEDYTGLALITQTWKLTLDQWPTYNEPWWDGVRQGSMNELHASGRAADVLLPRYPLQSIDTITADGDSVTVSNVFIVDDQQRPGRLVLKQGQTWPIVSTLTANGIVITYVAGYGDAASDVPHPLKLALLQMVAFLYEHRGDGCSAEKAMYESGAKSVFDQYRVAML